jgi:hypothetical protein
LWNEYHDILNLIDSDAMIKQANLDRFAKTWLDLFRFPKLPIYLHILIEHYNEKVECFGGLKKISQENVESHHLYEKQCSLGRLMVVLEARMSMKAF